MINMCAATSSPTQTTKVLVLGEKGVGKTCLIRSLLNEELPKVYESTQDNWYSTSIKITDKKENKIHFLDTGSYDDCHDLIECYMKSANIFLVVLDYSYKRTYLSARRIIREIRSVRGDAAVVICASTKCDKVSDVEPPVRVIDELDHIMCSATQSVGILEIKNLITEQVKSIHRDLHDSKLSRRSRFASSVKKILKFKKPVRRSETSQSMCTPTTPSIIVSPTNGSPSLSSGSHRATLLQRSTSLADPDYLGLSNCALAYKHSGDGSRSLSSSRNNIHKIGSLKGTRSFTSLDKQVEEVFKRYGYERRVMDGSTSPQSPTVSERSMSLINDTAAAFRSLGSSVVSLLNK